MTRRVYTNPALCSGCRACSVACALVHFGIADDALGAIQVVRDPLQRYEYQTVCRVCEDPECVAACMAAALARDPETGRIIVDRDRCIGCWMCVMVCPHGAVVASERLGKAIICDQCFEREQAACVAACSTGAIQMAEAEDTAGIVE